MALRGSELRESMRKLSKFLTSQKGLLDEGDYNTVLKTHAENLKSQIGGCKTLDADEATAICDVINGMPFTPGVKKTLHKQVSDRLLQADNKQVSPMAKMQDVRSFGKYYSETDRRTMRDQTISSATKLDILSTRCLAVGLFYPNEQAFGRVLASAVAAGLCTESVDQFYEYLQDFKKALKKKRKGMCCVSRFQTLPEDPSDLPEELRAEAYGEETILPVEELKINQVLSQLVNLRSSSKRVTAQPRGAESSQLQWAGSSQGAPSMDMLVSAIGMVMERHRDQKQRGHAGSSSDIPLQFNKKTVPPKKKPLMIAAKPESENEDEDENEEPEAPAEDEAQILPEEEAPVKTKKRPLLALPDITAAEQAEWLKKPSTKTTPEAPHLGADPLNLGPMIGMNLSPFVSEPYIGPIMLQEP